MSKNAIGSLSVLISANAGGFDATVAKVANDVNNLHKRIKPPKPIDLGFSGMAARAISPIPAMAAASIGTAGLAAAGGMVASKMLDTIKDTAKLGEAAKAMGMTAQQFTGIAAVARSAGEDTREFIESLVTMGKVIDDGFHGRGEVAADFFRTINMNARDFIGLRPDQQFFKIFDALRQIQDPAQRVRALMVAFGEDGGKSLLNALSKSNKELREIAQQGAMTNVEMKQMAEASLAIDEASAAIDKSWKSIAAAASPAVKLMANELTKVVKNLTPAAEAFESFALRAGIAVGLMADDIERVAETMKSLRPDGGENPIPKPLKYLGGPAGFLMDRYVKSGKDAKELEFPGRAGEFAMRFKAMLKEIEAAKKLADDSAAIQADPAVIQAKKLADDTKQVGNGVERPFVGPPTFDEYAKQRREAFRGGDFDKLRMEAQLLQQQFRAGLIAKNDFLAGMGKMVMDLDGVMDRHETQLPAAMLRGTQEVESLISKAISGQGQNNPMQRVADTLARMEQKQLTEQKIALEFGRELGKRLEFKEVRW